MRASTVEVLRVYALHFWTVSFWEQLLRLAREAGGTAGAQWCKTAERELECLRARSRGGGPGALSTDLTARLAVKEAAIPRHQRTTCARLAAAHAVAECRLEGSEQQAGSPWDVEATAEVRAQVAAALSAIMQHGAAAPTAEEGRQQQEAAERFAAGALAPAPPSPEEATEGTHAPSDACATVSAFRGYAFAFPSVAGRCLWLTCHRGLPTSCQMTPAELKDAVWELARTSTSTKGLNSGVLMRKLGALSAAWLAGTALLRRGRRWLCCSLALLTHFSRLLLSRPLSSQRPSSGAPSGPAWRNSMGRLT